MALLVGDLVPLLDAYAAACVRSDGEMRLALADAILQGLSADPELLLTRLDLLGPSTMIEDLFVDRAQAGAERDVAQKVEDLQKAGEDRKPEDICSEILASALVQQLEAAGVDCADEMEKAIDDADEFDLDVQTVDVSGNTATATVKRGDDGPTETMEFARENDQWRATSLSG